MSDQDKRSPEEIEADLVRTRRELAASVDELTDMLDPKAKLEEVKANLSAAARQSVDDAKAGAKQALDDAKAMASSFVKDVKGGDPKAVGFVGAGVAAVAVVVLAGVGARHSKKSGGAVAKYAAWRRQRQYLQQMQDRD